MKSRLSCSGLRARLMLLVLLAILPALVLILRTGMEQRQTDVEQSRTQMFQIARLIAHAEAELLYDNGQGLLSTMAQLPDVRNGSPAQCGARLAELLPAHAGYNNLGVIDSSGGLICSAIPAPNTLDLSDRSYFQIPKQNGGFALGDFIIGRISGKPSIPMGYAINDKPGALYAVAYALLNVSEIDQVIKAVRLAPDDTITVLDRNGVVLAQQPSGFNVGKLLPANALREAVLRQSTDGSIEMADENGAATLHVFTSLGDSVPPDGHVVVSSPLAGILADADRGLTANLFALAGALTLALLAAYVGADLFVLRHVRALVRTTKHIAEGDLSARTHIERGPTEIVSVAGAFDRMAEALAERDQARGLAEKALRTSETRLQKILESVAEAILVIDAQFRIALFNSGAEHIFGWDTSEVIGQPIAILMPKHLAHIHDAHMHDFANSADNTRTVSHRNEFTAQRKDGSQFPVLIGISKYQDAGQLFMVAILTDITKQQQASDALRASEAKNRALLDAIPDMMFRMKLDGTLLDFKPGRWQRDNERMSGAPGAKVVEIIKGLRTLPPEIGERLMQETRQMGSASVHEYRSEFTIDGQQRHVETRLVAIEGKEVLGIVRDVSDRHLAQAQLEKQLQRLAALHEIDQAVNSGLDLKLTLGLLLQQLALHLQIDAACILLYDPVLRVLQHSQAHGFRRNAIHEARIALGHGPAGAAAQERRTIHLARMTPAVLSDLPALRGEGFLSGTIVPLVAKGKILGVLGAFRRTAEPLADDWETFLDMLAGQAAIAVESASMFSSLQRSNSELVIAYDTTIESWSRALDLRDRETEGHSRRVTELTVQLARLMRLGEAELQHIRHGALLHDIGKMGIPDGILLKPGPLTSEEWTVMRKHPVYAYELLLPIGYLRQALDIPYCHHEKWDGTGYPRGMKGTDIPLAARIFAIVDVWDALRSDRPYRPAWPKEKVIEHIRSQSGTHFDPQVVEHFVRLVE